MMKDHSMATEIQMAHAGGDAAVLARLIRPNEDNLPADEAKALLNIRFDSHEFEHIHELVTKNQGDALTPAEKADLESYLRVSALIDLLHAKARRSLGMISEELSSPAENLTVPHPRFQFSLRWLMALTALSAGACVIVSRPESFALLMAFVIVALVGSLCGRSMGRSGLMDGLVAGVTATVTFQAIEVAYYHTLNVNNHSVAQLFNVAAAPLAGAVIGVLVGLTVWFVGWLTGWPAQRGGSNL
jgi:hypothetical protein